MADGDQVRTGVDSGIQFIPDKIINSRTSDDNNAGSGLQTATAPISQATKSLGDLYGTLNPPLMTHRFTVEVEGLMLAYFAEVSAIVVETAVYEYGEGGENNFTHKLPGRHKVNNVSLKRGVDTFSELWKWYNSSLQGKTPRKNVTIKINGDLPMVSVRTYVLYNAFPVRWTSPAMNASGTGGVAIETLEFACERLEVERFGLDNPLKGIL